MCCQAAMSELEMSIFRCSVCVTAWGILLVGKFINFPTKRMPQAGTQTEHLNILISNSNIKLPTTKSYLLKLSFISLCWLMAFSPILFHPPFSLSSGRWGSCCELCLCVELYSAVGWGFFFIKDRFAIGLSFNCLWVNECYPAWCV